MFFRKLLILTSLSTLLVHANVSAQSNIIERILANPKIQALIGKPAEITSLLNLCNNAPYQRANPQSCAEAAQADMVLKLPFEMRTVMSNQKSAQSLRDLCLAAQSTAQRDSFLCAELAKADQSFGVALTNERQRVTPQPGFSNEASN
jgi:hypothetical protein